ncbi:general secretion pathway protein F [Buttiauxella brennerae ATCC 51605]|jgi:general secretion pathway protein F|uniref:General secretion pathway protein F n=1 Tax=Buttiauxella brennerae ATCC 51605 TaxID=1354251 RepID=A0A1B7IQB8_9ENTR|nr:type II secretion system inner membrane protein GspF [Buttiauxella brennerae]OAT31930.1 general secretion pathway protein F [Buttiauxella brennerae ATCC 51605]
MADFRWQALDSNGKSKQGLLEADSLRHARQQLRERQLLPVTIAEVDTSTRTAHRFLPRRAPGMRRSELTLFTRQLATLLASGIPLEEALNVVSQQTEKARLRTVINAVRSRVLEGQTLAKSLAENPAAFDELYCAMVAAGEKSSHLDQVLIRLADYTEQRQQMQNKLRQAMVYPLVLTLVAVGVIAILLVTVVPNVVEQFVHMKQQLPLSTRLLMGISAVLQQYGLAFLAVVTAAALYWQRWLKTPANRLRYHNLILRLPIAGRLSRATNTARFASTLSILNASSVPLLDAMQISGEVLQNAQARLRITLAQQRVREGSTLRAALTQTRLFPPMMLHMIASGERSGTLDSMLSRAADNQDNALQQEMTLALSLFEPLLVVSMASVVLFIVLAILEPILQLNNMISH